jgi:hypothetical protein
MPKQITMWQCDLCSKTYATEGEALVCCQPHQQDKRKYCQGCYNDCYNTSEVNGCWSLDGAKLGLKKEVPIDQVPPWNQEPIRVLSCFKKKGYVYVGPEQTC